MVWEARITVGGKDISLIRRLIPTIDHPVMDDAICRVLLLTLGSLPLWLVLILFVAPPLPSENQLFMTLLVALFSGVAATSLFLGARHLAKSPSELAAVDCTQSMEVIFSLAGEAFLLGGIVPGPMGWAGIALTLLGLVLYLQMQKV
jgi:drug/metabolite transporter (DMT)-like permease